MNLWRFFNQKFQYGMQQSGQLDGSLEVLIPKVSDVERTGHIREIDVFDGSE